MATTNEQNAYHASLEILKILDKYNLTRDEASVVFDMILDDDLLNKFEERCNE
jgi:hypothetical protein